MKRRAARIALLGLLAGDLFILAGIGFQLNYGRALHYQESNYITTEVQRHPRLRRVSTVFSSTSTMSGGGWVRIRYSTGTGRPS